MRFLLLLLLAFAGCRCDVSPLNKYCPLGTPCANTPGGVELLPDGAQLAGECRAGAVVACKENGSPICEGEVAPTDEVCGDLLDNDCDGLTDNVTLRPFEEANTCEPIGICAYGYQVCVNGTWICDYPQRLSSDACNCRDDDCDGAVDEDAAVEEALYPFDRYPGTAGVGECKIGVRRCENCRMSEIPPVTPVAEILSNCKDDDCDGLTDEDDEEDVTRAFAIVFDQSGSMDDERYTLTAAVCEWSQNAMSADSLFAIINVGYGISPTFTALAQDFSDAATTCGTLLAGLPSGYTSGTEFMLEGISEAGLLEWPPADELVVLAFGDEPIQVYQVTVPEIENDCFSVPYRLGVFAEWSYTPEWSWAATSCGGFVEYFVNDATVMAQILREHFSGVGSCE
jgi:hypothetical protein